MARIKISKKDGTETPYFWSDKEPASPTHKTVFKQTEEGVKRMKGVYFDTVAKRLHKV